MSIKKNFFFLSLPDLNCISEILDSQGSDFQKILDPTWETQPRGKKRKKKKIAMLHWAWQFYPKLKSDSGDAGYDLWAKN
jgi:hypothetical protein